MAAASIGQVHRAVLHDGRQVAVKVQYPGVADAIRHDLANTELLSTFLRFAASAAGMKSDAHAVAREAAARISEEVDYRHETAMITAFGELYRGHPFIRIPEVIAEASTGRVLTMTYLDGIDWAAAQHADPHPGNYRFNADGSVGFLDFGCVKVLPELQRRRLVAQSRAAAEGRKEDLRSIYMEMGFIDADSDLTADEIYHWNREILYETLVAPQPVTMTPEATGRAIRGLFDVRDAGHPIARMKTPDDLVFVARVQIAVSSVLAGLHATLPARAMLDDMDGVAEPVTELGKLHHAWVRDRGLPSALDHHQLP